MRDFENWDALGIQAEFADLNQDLVNAVINTPDAKYVPLTFGSDSESTGVEYALRRHGLIYEVFRALPQGRLVKITEKITEERKQQVVTSQGEQTFTDLVPVETIYRLFPDGRWELSGESRSTLLGEVTSWVRRIPLESQKILQVFGLNPMNDAYMRTGIRRTREIAQQIIERR